jgi:gliding motility-associated-like protein
MRIFFVLVIPIFCHIANAQQANIWYFGNYLGLDFNYSPSKLLLSEQAQGCDSSNDMESSSTVSDKNGVLLFYTDGITVWNKNHLPMSNGRGLFGSCTSTQTLITPDPGNKNRYYVFTTSPQGDDTQFPLDQKGFRYSTVDLSLDNGLGDVVDKNILLAASTTEKVAGTLHVNKKDYWIVMHEYGSNAFNAFLITAKGIDPPITSMVGSIHQGNPDQQQLRGFNAIGQMKISPDGEKLGLTLYQDHVAEIFSFDPSSGALAEIEKLSHLGTVKLYGLEFSPNSELIYISDGMKYIYQYSLKSKETTVLENEELFFDNPYQLQLAPDGKIYIAKYEMYNLGVIEFPNLPGPQCSYKSKGVVFDVDGVHFSKQGLPNFISSFFYDETSVQQGPYFEMPNVVTPNDDHYNDQFVPKRFYNISSIHLIVYNRWGQIVFQSDEIDNVWGCDDEPTGVYYWEAEIVGTNGKNSRKKGIVSVVK